MWTLQKVCENCGLLINIRMPDCFTLDPVSEEEASRFLKRQVDEEQVFAETECVCGKPLNFKSEKLIDASI